MILMILKEKFLAAVFVKLNVVKVRAYVYTLGKFYVCALAEKLKLQSSTDRVDQRWTRDRYYW